MKKLLVSMALALGLASAPAAVYSYQSFLNGWNLCVSNNVTMTAGYTNNLFTYIHGEVYNSFTTNGTGQNATNWVAPDAFQSAGVDLFADAQGDITSNAVIAVYVGNTNWIPVVVTNSAGQYFVTNWSLATQMYPTYMYPATTNYYPAINAAAATNVLTFNFVRSTGPVALGVAPVFETTTSFSFSVTHNGVVPVYAVTNLPTTWLQGGRLAKLVSVTSASYSVNAISIVNAIGIGQWKP